jgi:hypothetical protein
VHHGQRAMSVPSGNSDHCNSAHIPDH